MASQLDSVWGVVNVIYEDDPRETPCNFPEKCLNDETGLYYYGQRFHSPQLGRWVSRDPAEERGGIHLYLSFKNSPLNIVDLLGMWGTIVHYGKTLEWASESFWATKALVIARADEGIDSGATSPLPSGQQSRHLKYTLDGQDSRTYWYRFEYRTALIKLVEADRNNDVQICSEAAAAFGRGLHSGQDISAHRPWPTGGGDWQPLVIHPGWWDDWNAINSTFPNMDVFWANYASSVGALGGVYDKWRGSSEQVSSQENARYAVTQFSRAAIRSFVDDVKKSCICKRELLRFSLW